MIKRSLYIPIVLVLIVISGVGMYFLLEEMFQLVAPMVEEAAPIEKMFTAHYIIIAGLFALVTVFLLFSIVAFRRKPGDDSDGEYTHGNTAIEVAWTVLPLVLVVGFAIWGVRLFNDLTDAEAYEARNPIEVNVTGFKWGWRFEYPAQGDANDPDSFYLEKSYELSNLYLPKGRVAKLNLTSEDILHAFWVPAFRIKQDVLPDVNRTIYFTPNVTNEEYLANEGATADDRGYRGVPKVRCAEICGTSHAYMLAGVEVVEEADYLEIIDKASQISTDPLVRGQQWYTEYACAGCHSLDGSDGSGPTWQGIYGRDQVMDDGTVVVTDDEYLRESIYDPNAKLVSGYVAGVMTQTFEQQFAEKEAIVLEETGLEIDMVDDLIEYMKTLE